MVADRVVRVGRVYDPPEDRDGNRVLVDRIWPRGLTKAEARLDRWCKNVAPSTELRRWYAHDPAKFDEFRRRYHHELQASPARDALAELRDLAQGRGLTLLTATRDVDHSNAAVLADLLDSSS
ncbi:MAG: DUF488 domain-containing protein [Pseudonocardiaceae bacterium]